MSSTSITLLGSMTKHSSGLAALWMEATDATAADCSTSSDQMTPW